MRQFPLYNKTEPPTVLKEHFNEETFSKSQAYGKDKAKFSFVAGIYRQILESGLIHFGAYAWAWVTAGKLIARFGYGPEYEVRPLDVDEVENCDLTAPDATINHLYGDYILRLCDTDYATLCISNICSRRKARFQQNNAWSLCRGYSQGLGSWHRHWRTFPCRFSQNIQLGR